MKRARKHGGDQVISTEPRKRPHSAAYVLQKATPPQFVAPSWDEPMSTAQFDHLVAAAVKKEKAKSAHYVDMAASGQSFEYSTTGTIRLIATIANGSSVNQRFGKKIAYKGVQIRGFIDSGSTTQNCYCATMLVYDRKPTNALPAITDILVAVNSGSFLNDVNSDRFQIVRRLNHMLIGVDGNNSASAFFIDEYVKLNKRPAEFGSAGTGAIGDITKGALYLVTVGDVATGTADGAGVLNTRTRFIDLDG